MEVTETAAAAAAAAAVRCTALLPSFFSSNGLLACDFSFYSQTNEAVMEDGTSNRGIGRVERFYYLSLGWSKTTKNEKDTKAQPTE